MSETFLNGKVVLHPGDSRDVLKTLADNSIDSIVTDPPYALVSIVKRFGAENSAAVKVPEGGSGAYARASSGFMGRVWDTGETAFAVDFWADVLRVLKPGAHIVAFGGTRSYHRLASAIEDAGFEIRDQIGWTYGSGFPKSHDAGNGWGTALKPAWEPICLARKPLSEKTVIANVERWGTGAINIDGCRIETDDEAKPRVNQKQDEYFSGKKPVTQIPFQNGGRWPANIIHDGSEEVIAAFPESDSTASRKIVAEPNYKNEVYGRGMGGPVSPDNQYTDGGSAARFFYSAKADSMDRLGSRHPTVKPVDLIRYLCRLVTPRGGTVLDMFAGTGTTGEAAFREGFNAILIEREEEYQSDIRRRMGLVLSGPDERSRESIKARTAGQPVDHGPLFAEPASQPASQPAKYANGRSKCKFFVALDPIVPSDQ